MFFLYLGTKRDPFCEYSLVGKEKRKSLALNLDPFPKFNLVNLFFSAHIVLISSYLGIEKDLFL